MSELIFIYNAESGVANALVDYGKKLVAPKSYDCQLCMVTYGPFGMKKDWKDFIKQLNMPVRFLHKDEFEKEFSTQHPAFPCVIENSNNKLKILLSNEDLKSIDSLEDLKQKVLELTN